MRRLGPEIVPGKTWEQELRDLFVRSDMSVDEFDRLLDTALRDERPDHPDLPAFREPDRSVYYA